MTLAALERRIRQTPPPEPLPEARHGSFLNWAVEESDRLHAEAVACRDPQQRFFLNNRIAGIASVAYAYGQWLCRESDGGRVEGGER